MEYVVNTCEMSLQVNLVCSLAHALEDPKWAQKPLTKLTYSRQMQVDSVQQHPIPNLVLVVPVMAVKVPLLVLLCLQQVNLGSLKQVLDVQAKSPATVLLPAWTTTSSGERGSSPMVSSVGTYPVLSAIAELIANST